MIDNIKKTLATPIMLKINKICWAELTPPDKAKKIQNLFKKSLKEQQTPMGVSQWKEHGKKYGYWDYFLKEIDKLK